MKTIEERVDGLTQMLESLGCDMSPESFPTTKKPVAKPLKWKIRITETSTPVDEIPMIRFYLEGRAIYSRPLFVKG